jgi:F420H(2)-dependent quinone reductase
MIDLSTTLGRILSPTNHAVGWLRDAGLRAAGRLPGAKERVLQHIEAHLRLRDAGYTVHLIADFYPDDVVVGTDTFDATAVHVTGDERDRLFALMVEVNPQLGTYGTMTSREIPVFVIERKSP